jgi:hypothetical protein
MSPVFRFVVKWARTVHLYLTLFCLGLLLFFGVTGFMLNHEGWFVSPTDTTTACEVPPELLKEPEQHELQIVELLRAKYGVVGALSTVEDLAADSADSSGQKPLLDISEEEVRAVFKRPGTQVAVVLYREEQTTPDNKTFTPGQGEITVHTTGANGLLLDLHRGKDTSGPWHLVIDLIAGVYLVVAATGIVMWWSLKGRGKYGLWVAVGGVVLSVLVVWVFELVLAR